MTSGLPDWSKAAVLKGIDETGVYRVALLDESGAIICVLQGEYLGILKTVALDEHGRIPVVITDPEDVFGNPSNMGGAELAARLGSINTFERRGQTVWMDDFEAALLKWTPYYSGGTGIVALSTLSARNGNQSVKLTTGKEVYDYTIILHETYTPRKSRIGLECSFALGPDLLQFDMGARIYDGTKIYTPGLRYRPPANLNDLQVCSGWDVYTPFASGVDLAESDLCYHTWKLVFDYETKKYVRAIVDDIVYDLSAYTVPSSAYELTPIMEIDIRVYNNITNNHYVYVDDFILTQNEL